MKKIIEYKIFENTNPGDELKKMDGCVSCDSSPVKPPPNLKKILADQKQVFSGNVQIILPNAGGVRKDVAPRPKTGGKKDYNYDFDGTFGKKLVELNNLVRNYYTGWYAKQETRRKFSSTDPEKQWGKLIDFINKKVQIILWWTEIAKESVDGGKWFEKFSDSYGWVWGTTDSCHMININIEKINGNLDQLKQTIFHEMGHCISYFMILHLHMSPVRGNKNFGIPGQQHFWLNDEEKKMYEPYAEDENEEYLMDSHENITRLQTIRRSLRFSPNSDCESIKQILEKYLQSRELEFDNISSWEFIHAKNNGGNPTKGRNTRPKCWFLKLIPDLDLPWVENMLKSGEWPLKKANNKEMLLECWFENIYNSDFTRFFAHISIAWDDALWIDLEWLTKMNQDLVMNDDDETKTRRV